MRRNKLRFILDCLVVLMLIITANSTNGQATTDLIVNGNVLGYNLYTIKPTSNPGLMYPALVRVTRVVEGEEKSPHILVLFESLKEEFALEIFGLDKTSTFKLKRQAFCDKKIESLMYPGLTLENGKQVTTPQTFTLVRGVSKKSLPLKKKIPCYFILNAE